MKSGEIPADEWVDFPKVFGLTVHPCAVVQWEDGSWCFAGLMHRVVAAEPPVLLMEVCTADWTAFVSHTGSDPSYTPEKDYT